MRIDEAVRLLRAHHDLKQNQLARLLDMSTSYVSEIEKGRKMPTLDVLDRIARTFDIATSSLLYLAEIVTLPPKAPLPPYPTEKALRLVELSQLRRSLNR